MRIIIAIVCIDNTDNAIIISCTEYSYIPTQLYYRYSESDDPYNYTNFSVMPAMYAKSIVKNRTELIIYNQYSKISIILYNNYYFYSYSIGLRLTHTSYNYTLPARVYHACRNE